MYHPYAVANFFIGKSFDTGIELTPMKLVKLAYIAHGWNLAINNKPLLSEGVEAWKYGPVVPTIYHLVKEFGRDQVTKMCMVWNNNELIVPQIREPEALAVLEDVWKGYSHFTGHQLSSWTHEPNTPWSITWHKHGGSLKRGAIIANDLIKEFFTKLGSE